MLPRHLLGGRSDRRAVLAQRAHGVEARTMVAGRVEGLAARAAGDERHRYSSISATKSQMWRRTSTRPSRVKVTPSARRIASCQVVEKPPWLPAPVYAVLSFSWAGTSSSG